MTTVSDTSILILPSLSDAITVVFVVMSTPAFVSNTTVAGATHTSQILDSDSITVVVVVIVTEVTITPLAAHPMLIRIGNT